MKTSKHSFTTPPAGSGGSAKADVPRRLRRAIEAVRKQLPAATDFEQLYELFDERVGRAPGLWEHSHRREHQLLFSMAVHIAQQVRPGFEPQSSMLFDVADTGFSHGVVIGTTAMACLFYDEHAGMGLVAICEPSPWGRLFELVRFRPVMFGHVHGAVIEPGGSADRGGDPMPTTRAASEIVVTITSGERRGPRRT